ncbi:MAG: RHS repeat-associated core domain-containing protein [Kofleriaceae bacterium]
MTWRYDRETGRLVEQDAVRAGRQWQGLRYTYDADGLITRAQDVAQDGAGAIVPAAVSARRDFAYDAHGRLLEATGRIHQALLPQDGGPAAAGSGLVGGARHLSLNNGAALERFTQRFTYDAGGNLRRVQHLGTTASWATDYWVAAGSNRSVLAVDGNGVPVSDVDAAASFDARGNLTRLAHLRAMTWSWRGCLAAAVTVERAAGPVDDGERYAYGADRMRVRKVETRLVAATGGGADGSQPVIETRDVVYLGGGQERVRVRRGSGAGADTIILERWTTHVEDGERRVAVLDRHTVDTLAAEVDTIGPARVRYQLTTPQGSASVELDDTGRLISYEEYLPHGASAFIAGDDAREVARRDVRYAGKERDRATGLQAYPYRYYAPWLARWLTCDPIGPKDGLNLYAFVGGDPIGMVDPEGTEKSGSDDAGMIKYRHTATQPWLVKGSDAEAWSASQRADWVRAQGNGTGRRFAMLSEADQARYVAAQEHLALVVNADPRSSEERPALLSIDVYRNNWVPARQQWRAERRENLVLGIPSNNPEAMVRQLDGGGGGGGGSDKEEVPKSAKVATANEGSKKRRTTTMHPGAGGDGSSAAGYGGGDDNGTSDAQDAGVAGAPDVGPGMAAWARIARQGAVDDVKGRQGGSVSGTDFGDISGGYGGTSGGVLGGVIGGTPHANGVADGGTGVQRDSGARDGLGLRPGRGAGGDAGDIVGAGGGEGRRSPSQGGVRNLFAPPAGAVIRRSNGWDILTDISAIANFSKPSGSVGGSDEGVAGGRGWLSWLKGRPVQIILAGASVLNSIFTFLGLAELVAGLAWVVRGLGKLPGILGSTLGKVFGALGRVPAAIGRIPGQVARISAAAKSGVGRLLNGFRGAGGVRGAAGSGESVGSSVAERMAEIRRQVAEELGDDLADVEMFLHGTTDAVAPNFQLMPGRDFFATFQLTTAKLFAARSVAKSGSGSVGLVVLVLPRSVVANLRAQKFLIPKWVDDMPGVLEWVFSSSAYEAIVKHGEFVHVKGVLK